jgi:hypothetical protein
VPGVNANAPFPFTLFEGCFVMNSSEHTEFARRRTLLQGAALALAMPTAAGLLASPASASEAGSLPDYVVAPSPYFERYGPSGNAWAIFEAYLGAVARHAAEPVAAKYAGLLAAADVYTVDNAFALLESHRIDGGLLGPFGIRP